MTINLKKLTIIFCTFLCIVYHAQGMENSTNNRITKNIQHIQKNIETLIQQKITIDIQSKKNEIFTTTTITLLDTKTESVIARSSYTYNSVYAYLFSTITNGELIEFDSLSVEAAYKNKGVGEQLFYLTMYAIKDEYPSIYDIAWFIQTDTKPEHLSWREAADMLCKFYRRVGAKVTLDNGLELGSINLKEAGYCDEN